jgi:hypothetical protein
MARGGRMAVALGPRVGVALLGNWFHHTSSNTTLHRRRGTGAGRAGDPLPSLADAGLGKTGTSALAVEDGKVHSHSSLRSEMSSIGRHIRCDGPLGAALGAQAGLNSEGLVTSGS